ncbi:E3 ubiquitin-protein ligase RNF4 isoform X1 [Vanacampus margaritifer]
MSAFDVQTEIVRPPNSRRPRQAEVRKLTKLSASEERNATHPGGRVSRYCCFRPLAMNNTRKRRNAGSLLVSGSPKPRGHATASRAAHANRRANASRAAGRRNSPQGRRALAVADTIDVMDNMEDEGVEEVVDLTSEAVEAAMHVVDLTNNDSVLLVDEGARGRRSNLRESYVVSSDDDDAVSSSVPSANVLTSLQTQSSTRCVRACVQVDPGNHQLPRVPGHIPGDGGERPSGGFHQVRSRLLQPVPARRPAALALVPHLPQAPHASPIPPALHMKRTFAPFPLFLRFV